MKTLKTGKSADGVGIQVENWNDQYSSMPYGNILACYPKSRATHKGPFAPKEGEEYRFTFAFPSYEQARMAFAELENGSCTFIDYLDYWDGKPEYKNCIEKNAI